MLLIDEIDRADEAFEAFLLELLSDFQISVPEMGTIQARHIPYVILTSNRTRELSDALKRRCLYHWIDYPSFEKEMRIVRATAARHRRRARHAGSPVRSGVCASSIWRSRLEWQRRWTALRLWSLWEATAWMRKRSRRRLAAWRNPWKMSPSSGQRESTNSCPRALRTGGHNASRTIRTLRRLHRRVLLLSQNARTIHAPGPDNHCTRSSQDNRSRKDRQSFAFALQSALCSTQGRVGVCSRSFSKHSGAESHPRPRSASGEYKGPSQEQCDTGTKAAALRSSSSNPVTKSAAQDGDGKAVYGASAQQRLKKVDFSEVPCDDLASLEELSLRLLRRMSLRLSRRLTISNLTDRVDLRRSIRRSITHGGEPIESGLQRQKAKKEQAGNFSRHQRLDEFLQPVPGAICLRAASTASSAWTRFSSAPDVVEISDLLRTRASAGGSAKTLAAGSGLVGRYKDRGVAPAVQPTLREASCSRAIPSSSSSATDGIPESRRCLRRRCGLPDAARKESCG